MEHLLCPGTDCVSCWRRSEWGGQGAYHLVVGTKNYIISDDVVISVISATKTDVARREGRESED